MAYGYRKQCTNGESEVGGGLLSNDDKDIICSDPSKSFVNERFTKNLYTVMKHNSEENVSFSPLSLETCLALVYLGAGGSTALEIRKALDLPRDTSDVLKLIQSALELTESHGLSVNLANGLFANKGAELDEEFMEMAEIDLKAGMKELDFTSPNVTDIINLFVYENTHGKIADMFFSDSFRSITGLALVNILVFEAEWKNYFQKDYTDYFFLKERNRVRTEFMSIEGDYRYSDNVKLRASIIMLPYCNNSFFMALIVPDEIEGLAEVEEKLLHTDLKDLLTGKLAPVALEMPRFHSETENDFVEHLKQLGVKTIFSEEDADLSGIFKTSVKCEAVKQKVIMDINTKGTTVAKALGDMTAIAIGSKMEPVYKMRADRPFIYLICHQPTSMILFMGRLCTVTEDTEGADESDDDPKNDVDEYKDVPHKDSNDDNNDDNDDEDDDDDDDDDNDNYDNQDDFNDFVNDLNKDDNGNDNSSSSNNNFDMDDDESGGNVNFDKEYKPTDS